MESSRTRSAKNFSNSKSTSVDTPSKTEPPLSAQTASMFSTAKRTTCENNVSAPTLRANSAKSKTHLESNWWWARECCAKALREGTSRFFGGFLGLDEEGGASSSPNQHASGVSDSSVESCDWSSDSSSDATDVSYVDGESPNDAAIPSAAVENKTSSSSCIPSPSSARETRSTDGRVNARVANTCISPMCTAVTRRIPFTFLNSNVGGGMFCCVSTLRVGTSNTYKSPPSVTSAPRVLLTPSEVTAPPDWLPENPNPRT
mmetsp:Transcript_13501/g.50575  ORF Transcript_13501/g.50575 Transcript_13501/m.50575 type:complete len:260 (+) Transcript_13501:1668-2447(+)